MARIPIEDNFNDVINKAQRGLQITDERLAQRAGISLADLAAVKAGRVNTAAIRRVAPHLRLSADALDSLAHKRFYPEAPTFPRGLAMFNTRHEDMTVNSYLVWDCGTRLAAAFDTGANCTAMLDTLHVERLTLRYIFLTHTHDDHVAALPALTAAAPRAEVWSSELEPVAHPGAKFFKENAHFHLGEIAIKTLLTAGHSPGQTTFFVTGLARPLAIVGDSVFACSMGGSAARYADQLRNNRDKIIPLPRDTVIAPGHGPLTTLAFEKRHNPFFAQ